MAPVLRAYGFQRVDARNGRLWNDEAICVFNVRAVGSYFRDVTGWPAASLTVWLGVYFPFIPRVTPLRKDSQGRLLPKEHDCAMRSSLRVGIDQSSLVQGLSNAAEKRRQDIWWVQADGSDAERAALDIASQLEAEGLPWYDRNREPLGALETVEAEHDCYHKLTRASYFAWAAGDRVRQRRYTQLARTEAARIGREWQPPPSADKHDPPNQPPHR